MVSERSGPIRLARPTTRCPGQRKNSPQTHCETQSENRADNVKVRAPVSSGWMSYADREGECAVRIAREALDAFVLRRARRPVEIPNGFEEKSGAFVTHNDHPGGLLRGCIGYPQPVVLHLSPIEKGAADTA